jgi:hypothetical protein
MPDFYPSDNFGNYLAHLFARTNSDTQVKLFGEMSPVEQETYFPQGQREGPGRTAPENEQGGAEEVPGPGGQEAPAEFHEQNTPVHPTGYYAPKNTSGSFGFRTG